jgi:hypothetical protein
MGVFERFNVLKRLLLLKWVGLKPTRWRKALLTSTPTASEVDSKVILMGHEIVKLL